MAVFGENSDAAPRTSTPRVWSFAGCVLDERSLELKVQNQIADLDRKPLEVLIHLLRHAGEVVTKDELAEAVWPGRIITDSNLTKTMAVLRAALGDSEATVIKTVHGYGYRLMAPVSVQAYAAEPALARFDFKPGESPPLRSHWQLSERLGTGSHGEVWLAHHSKTKEPRVFKFAEEGGGLTALKREITLNRLLRETLPGRDDYLRLLDWNFDEPPFFVESEYAAGGSLAAWAQSQGGFSKIPLATRLDLLAQAAEALAAAHSVGVLHKDLKPTNILVVEKDGILRVKLADFGSGGVLDSGALDALGITAMGFTQTVRADDTTSGTPLYLAPEVLAGQPFTVQSDIYALGVMLYQLVAGDTRKPLAPGWEKDVADELLREDIGAAAAGDPADRLADAGLLARRLRDLDARRDERAEIAGLAQSRVKLRRLRVTAGSLALLVAAVSAAAFMVWRASERALEAEATALAVNRFLINDVLGAASPERGPVRDLKMLDVLDRSSAVIDQRLAAEPAVAAQVHMSLGQSYEQLWEREPAARHYERAASLLAVLQGEGAVATLLARLRQGTQLVYLGRKEGCAMVDAAAAALDRVLDPHSEAGLEFRARAKGGCTGTMEQYRPIVADLEAAVAEMEQRGLTDLPAYTFALNRLGGLLEELLQWERAEAVWDKRISHSQRRYGPRHFSTSQARILRTEALLKLGRLREADAELAQATADREDWAGERGKRDVTVVYLAMLRIEQGRFEEAERQAREAELPNYQNILLQVRAESLVQLGRTDAALELVHESIRLSREEQSPPMYYEMLARGFWVEMLLRRGRVQEARGVLDAVSAAEVAEAPKMGGTYADWRRAEGLVLMAEGKRGEACAALRDALEFFERRYADDGWRRQRAKADYALCSADAALQR